VRIAFIRDLIAEAVMRTEYVASSYNLADFLTKAFSGTSFKAALSLVTGFSSFAN